MPATNELLQEESVSSSDFIAAMPPVNGEGDTLEVLLQRNKRAFPVSDVLSWADHLLDALGTLHKAAPPIFHQYVHPENIVLSPDGTVKLHGGGEPSSAGDPQIQIHYSPLEQIWDGLDSASQKVITNSYDERSERVLMSPLDARSDLYSLAATLYYLLTATQPVDALERSIEMLDGNADPLLDPSTLNPQVPAEVSQVLMKALEIKRENRFDSTAIMRQVLRSAYVKCRAREQGEAQSAEASAAAEQKKQEEAREAEEKTKQADLLEQKLRELEHQRREAEARAAEAERLLKEKEEAAAHVSTEPGAAEEELLELDISVMPNVESQLASSRTDSGSYAVHVSEADLDTIELSVIDDVPAPPASISKPHREVSDATIEKEFAYEEATGRTSMFGVPMMAAAAVVLIAVSVGIYFIGFSGTAEQPNKQAAIELKPETAPPPPVQQDQPVQSPEQVSSFAPESSTTASESNTAVSEPQVSKSDSASTSRAAVKPTPATKENKPAKEPAKGKKPVTADDLINDN